MKDDEEHWRSYIDETFVNGVAKLIILGKVKHHSTYPYEIYKQLKKHHFGPVNCISKSGVYNILNSLEKNGLVSSEPTLFGSKVQKKYSITNDGKRVSSEAKVILTNHLNEIKKLINHEFK